MKCPSVPAFLPPSFRCLAPAADSFDKGLISSLEDGRYKRYYPTNRLIELSDKHQKALRAYRKGILERLTKDGVAPKVLRSTDREMHIEIRGGKERRVLVLHTDPFMTVLQRHKLS